MEGLISLLPPEIREPMIEDALTHDGTISISSEYDGPAYLRTNRAVRDMRLQQYLEDNRFGIRKGCNISHWINGIGAENLMRHVTKMAVYGQRQLSTGELEPLTINLTIEPIPPTDPSANLNGHLHQWRILIESSEELSLRNRYWGRHKKCLLQVLEDFCELQQWSRKDLGFVELLRLAKYLAFKQNVYFQPGYYHTSSFKRITIEPSGGDAPENSLDDLLEEIIDAGEANAKGKKQNAGSRKGHNVYFSG